MLLTKKSTIFLFFFVKYCYGDKNGPQSLPDILKIFSAGEYSFRVGQPLSVHNPQVSRHQIHKVQLVDTAGYGNCLGLTIDTSETVILECPGKKAVNPGCFDVITVNKSSASDRQVTVACVQAVSSKCVGITTPNSLKISLSCLSSESKFPLSSTIVVPNNGPPPRM
ncbi:uncharacterized protein LOC108905676 [Anoplophora glabripennis]|uniref:uncharacterized protein LOC108905676 n=1 Tax=Anoplophora glabripennis TaxID=217634 RepID=UPI000873EACE|nr:uncharacterized protein LOC108905676 [Anoplophora glabripennis]